MKKNTLAILMAAVMLTSLLPGNVRASQPDGIQKVQAETDTSETEASEKEETGQPEEKNTEEKSLGESESYSADETGGEAEAAEPQPEVRQKKVAEQQGYLASLEWEWTGYEGKKQDLSLSEPFSPEIWDYRMEISDNLSDLFCVKGTLSEAAPEGSNIRIYYPDCFKEEEITCELSPVKFAEESNRLEYLTVSRNMSKAPLVTIQVGTEEDYQEYRVQLVKIPALWSDNRGLAVKNMSGRTLNLSPAYDFYMTDRYMQQTYSACLGDEAIQLTAMLSQYSPADDKDHESLCITRGGEILWQGEAGQDAVDVKLSLLPETDNEFHILLTYEKEERKSTEDYTLLVKQPKGLKFTVTPTDANIYLTDSYNNRYWPDEDTGTYPLANAETYTCYITRTGYVGQKLTLTGGEQEEIKINLQEAVKNQKIDESLSAEWGSFQGENAAGVTDAPTPYEPDDVDLLWATRFADPSTQVSAATGCPLLVDDCLVTWSSTKLKKINRYTGEVVAETEMAGQSTFSITPGVYADGMIFMAFYNGTVQAFNAKTLEPLWLYSSGVTNWAVSPICYQDGYIYVGYYGKTGLDFYCLSVTDEDPSRPDEEKLPTWQYACGGMYWAGAWANDSYVAVGSNNGTLRVFDRFTGELKDSWIPGGNLRSTISYDEASGRIFFTDSNVLCNAKISDDGTLVEKNTTIIINGAGVKSTSTSTVSVYNGRIYIGVCGDTQYENSPGHGIQVYDLEEDGSMKLAYRFATPGYPQSSAMISTAYEASDGYVYVYVQYNYPPGGLVVIKDKKGQTEPLAANEAEYSQVFIPTGPLSQYCICSPIADSEGTIYFKNDSNYLMALSSKILNIQVVQRPTTIIQNGDNWQAEGLKVVANLKNGQQRDVTDLVTITKDPDTGKFIATYTYGFDHADYGLQTQTTEVKVQSEGLSLTGTAVSWDNKDNLVIRLYKSTVSDGDIGTDIQKETPELCEGDIALTGQPKLNADNKRWDVSFTFEDLTPGSYQLVIYKPGKYVVKNLPVTVGTENVQAGELKLWRYGDVNYDGKVNAGDALQIQRYLVSLSSIFDTGTEAEKADRRLAANVTWYSIKDNRINAADALQIQRYCVGLTSALDAIK